MGRWQPVKYIAVVLAAVGLLAAAPSSSVAADEPPPGATPCLEASPAQPVCISGTLPDGTAYQFVVPDDWNRVVLVDLDFAVSGLNAAYTARLLERGFARGGTTRLVTGWNIRQAIDNQAAALERFEAAFGSVRWAIASGNSMGGFVSAAVAQVYPDRFDASVAFCPGLGGAVGQWNQKLDTVFALKTLLFPSAALPVIDIPEDVTGAQQAWISALAGAQATPEGRARIALATAIGQLPAWGVAPGGVALPRPGRGDTEALQEGLYLALAGGPLPYIGQAMSSRRQIEQLSGGNPSWNTGVDYRRQLSAARPEIQRAVRELYEQAGLDLQHDLGQLNRAPRISADPSAVEYLTRGIVFTGDLRIPVLTVSSIGDQISTVAQQQSYQSLVRESGNGRLLRQTYIESAGHCGYTPSEQTAAIVTMMQRLRTGQWPETGPGAMNRRAAAVDPGAAPGRYTAFDPERFNRRFPE
jgi:pimeloyl-ACP methyl ester carboxylesterase